MTYRKVNDDSLVHIADAIRDKGGTSRPLTFPDGFVSAIQTIKTGWEPNIHFIAGTTKPQNPQANTIWFMEDIEITSVAFSNVVPPAPSDGMLWVNTSLEKYYTPINIFKDNLLTMNIPTQSGECSGYKIYKNGSFSTLKYYQLYDGAKWVGRYYVSGFGGYVPKTGYDLSRIRDSTVFGVKTINSVTYGYFSAPRASYYDEGGIRIKGAIDLTKIKTIYLIADPCGSYFANLNCNIVALDSLGNEIARANRRLSVELDDTLLSMDVSALSGNHYIQLEVSFYKSTQWVYLGQMYMEYA